MNRTVEPPPPFPRIVAILPVDGARSVLCHELGYRAHQESLTYWTAQSGTVWSFGDCFVQGHCDLLSVGYAAMSKGWLDCH